MTNRVSQLSDDDVERLVANANLSDEDKIMQRVREAVPFDAAKAESMSDEDLMAAAAEERVAAIDYVTRIAEDPIEAFSDEEIASLIDRHERIQHQRALPEKQLDAALQFRAEAPDYVVSASNTQRMVKALAAAGYDGTDPDQYLKVFKFLKSKNLIATNPAAIPREPRYRPTEADLYEMSMEQLEDLARGR
jgi:hypothetical protein